MPCRDYYDDHPNQYFKDVTEPALKKRIAFAESALCQSLEALERVVVSCRLPQEFYDYISYENGGFTKKELVAWHTEHKARDAKIRETENNTLATALVALQHFVNISKTRDLTGDERRQLRVIHDNSITDKNVDRLPSEVLVLFYKYIVPKTKN